MPSQSLIHINGHLFPMHLKSKTALYSDHNIDPFLKAFVGLDQAYPV